MQGGFNGLDHQRGHRLLAQWQGSGRTVRRRTDVVIAGGGIAGLAAARALRLRGVEDFVVLELEDQPGGNSRSTRLGQFECPLGAHYLPIPGDGAEVVQDLLEEFGLRRRVAGRWEYDELHLCHSPQERLFFQGAWQEGLLPMQGVGAPTLEQYRKFARLVAQARATATWSVPVARLHRSAIQMGLSTVTMRTYLGQNGLHDPHLLWYLDYCCRDDYGAGISTVSAWAGMHYFASRHGFHVAGEGDAEREPVLTWPEGNAWLTRRLASPLSQAAVTRVHTGRVVMRIADSRHGVEVDALDVRTMTLERWQCRHCIVALPVHAAVRVVESVPAPLRQVAARTRHAPWLVANIALNGALHDRAGAPPSWDNVIYGNPAEVPGLGYVDAMHQSLRRVPGPTVITYYRALGDVIDARRLLMEGAWEVWRDSILAELAIAHPDLAAKAWRMDITRYGHAMAVPIPVPAGEPNSLDGWTALMRGANKRDFASVSARLSYAHGDWAGYSVFEEAFSLGHSVGTELRL